MIQLFPAGYLFIPIGFFLFIRGRKFIFYGSVLAIPFIGVQLVDFPGYNMNLPQFMIILLTTRAFLNAVAASTFHELTVQISIEKIMLLIFVFLALFSLIMPMTFAKGEPINPHNTPPGEDSYPLDLRQVPLKLTNSNITQFLYLVFFAVSFWIFTIELKRDHLIKIIRAIVISGLFVALSTTLYVLWVTLELPMLGELINFFNPLLVKKWWPRFQIPLLFSLIGEPGPTGHFMLIPTGLLFIFIIRGDRPLFGQAWLDRLILLYFMSVIFLAGTTGYVGLSVFLLTYLTFSFRKSILNFMRPALYITLFILTFIVLFNTLAGTTFLDYIEYVHLGKLSAETGSGLVRLKYARWSWELATKYPLLGVGWGSHRAPSLFPVLLSNLGFIGISVFLVFNLLILRRAWREFRDTKSSLHAILAISLICVFFGIFVSGVLARPIAMINTYTWYAFLLALMSKIGMIDTETERFPPSNEPDHSPRAD